MVLVRLVMVVARYQLCNEDARREEPNCDAQEHECRHSAHRPIELGGSRPSRGRHGPGPCGPGTRWFRQPFVEDAANGKRFPLSFASPIY